MYAYYDFSETSSTVYKCNAFIYIPCTQDALVFLTDLTPQ